MSLPRFTAAVLALLATTCAHAQNRPQAPVRVAIIGLVHGHVQGFLEQLKKHPEVRLVAVVEPDQALVQKYAKLFSLDRSLFSSNLERMLTDRHPDAVLVYTSIANHRPVIEAAAHHGISAMVEKPLATSLAEALAIRQVARQTHVHVLVNYETTWYASNRAAYEEANMGELGEIRKVVVHDGHAGPVKIGVGPEFLQWLTNPQQNGAGALFDFGCYGADLMTWLMHGASPLTVTAVTQNLQPQTYPHVDDEATVVLTYPRAQAILQASWNWPFQRKDIEVYGETGYLDTVALNGLRIRHHGDAQEAQTTAPPLQPPYDDSLHYLTAVLAGKVADKGDLSALDTNVVVMQILDAARTSARTGRTVTLQPLPQ